MLRPLSPHLCPTASTDAWRQVPSAKTGLVVRVGWRAPGGGASGLNEPVGRIDGRAIFEGWRLCLAAAANLFPLRAVGRWHRTMEIAP